VNLTINPRVYQAFKEATDKRLQPKSLKILLTLSIYNLTT